MLGVLAAFSDAAGEAAAHASEHGETFLGLGAEGWVAAAFFLFIGVLVWLGAHRFVSQALDARAEKIRAELDEARSLKEEAQEMLARLQREQRQAKRDAEAIIAQAEEDARLLLSEAQKQIEQISERRRLAAEQKIAQAKEQAVGALRAEAATLAATAARQLIHDLLEGEKGVALIDATIAEIAANRPH
ncbi:MAG: ATP F0F1 synthase subunit B [Rhodothalassiaceae bacterium]